MKKKHPFSVLFFLILFTLFCRADSKPSNEYDSAFQAAMSALKEGPNSIPLAGQAKLNLPPGYGFIPMNQAKRFMKAMGNTSGSEFQGMIIPTGNENANWFIVVSYFDTGYIKDEDAKTWNTEDLLKSIRSGTEESNQDRHTRGMKEIEVIGWASVPLYDAATHRLVWAIASRLKGDTQSTNHGINYNTLVLGRQGYVSLNLVTDMASLEALKPEAKKLLAALIFNEGEAYNDFNSSTDKVAAYGLAALVAGVAAKKLGLFAVLIAFVAKFIKVIAIALFAGFGSFFKRRKKTESENVPDIKSNS